MSNAELEEIVLAWVNNVLSTHQAEVACEYLGTTLADAWIQLLSKGE